jgi:hypothetical protein
MAEAIVKKITYPGQLRSFSFRKILLRNDWVFKTGLTL